MISVVESTAPSSKSERSWGRQQPSATVQCCPLPTDTALTINSDSTKLESSHADLPMEHSPVSSDGSDSKKNNSRPNRDPMSHRIIEKRRRDRMNNCLTNLSKLIPNSFLKKGRGRIEKTEIIEMAITYLRQLQQERARSSTSLGGALIPHRRPSVEKSTATDAETAESVVFGNFSNQSQNASKSTDSYQQGFYDCIAETLRFLATADDTDIRDATKARLLLHLRDYFCQSANGNRPPMEGSVLLTPDSPTIKSLAPSSSQPPVFQLSAPPSSSDESQQPLNMSLKRPKLNHSISSTNVVSSGSCLREMLSEAKEAEARGARPHVFRYTASAPALPDSGGGGGGGGGGSSSSAGYPSSPGSGSSGRSPSGGSATGCSPPRVLTPPPPSSRLVAVAVPAFALHPSGLFYVPISIGAGQLDSRAFLALTTPRPAASCHPVTITVNFCSADSTPPTTAGGANGQPPAPNPLQGHHISRQFC